MTRKLLLVALGVFVLFAAALLLVDFDSPELGRALLDRVAEEAGVEIRAERFRLNLVRGLELGAVAAAGELPGGAIEIEADAVAFRHRLAPLLRRELHVTHVVVERPRIAVGPQAAGPAGGTGRKRGAGTRTDAVAGAALVTGSPPRARRPPVTLTVDQIRLVDGSFSFAGEGGATEIRGFDVDLRDLGLDREAPRVLDGLTAAGALRADEVVVGETRATDAEGGLRFEAGHLLLENLRFETVEGRFVIESMDLDLGRDPLRYVFTLRGDPLDAAGLLGSASAGGGGLGDARLDLQAQGSGAGSSGLDGSGTISLEGGTLPATPAFTAVDRLVGRQLLVGSRYEPLEARFTVRRGRVRFEPFEFAAAELGLGVAGELGLDGSLDLRVEARLPRAGLSIPEVPGAVLDALTDEAGRVIVPLSITGTKESPRVRFDHNALLEGARRRRSEELKRDLEGQLKKKLGSLLGRDDG